MGLRPDAAPAQRREDAQRWRSADAAHAEQSVRRLQARIVQVGEYSMTQRRCAFVCIALTGS